MSIPVGAQDRWPDVLLDSMRLATDPKADQVVAELFGAGQVGSVNDLMRTLVENDGVPPEGLSPLVRDYLATSAVLPPWADPELIQTGERVFWRYGPAIIAILHCYSLPFCYAAANGVQVLALTSRLYSNPTRRIIETAQMVVDVMRPGGLTSEGTGIRTAQKVRLMHAAVRFLIGRYDGWKTEFGRPINQEDLIGTLMSFSWCAIDGLQRLGYGLTGQEAEAYLHCWKVVGHVLGMRPELQPANYIDAENLAHRIQSRQYAASEEGQMMTRALVQMMQYYLPGELLDSAPPAFIRYFLGDATGDLLGVHAERTTDLFVRPLEWAAHIKRDLVHSSNELAHLHELFARALIDGVLLAARGGKRTPFNIPTELLQAWGVNWVA